MHKLIVFDLDGTLAPIGKGVLDEDIVKLRELEAAGYRIAICSGKLTFYLCGFLRQIGLREPILVGENGAVIQYGVELPPERFYICPHSAWAAEQLRRMKERITAVCGNRVWFQPNEVELTPFPRDAEAFELIQGLVDKHPEDVDELEGLTRADFVAVGDGINDVPMFEFADVSVGIGGELEYETTYSFERIGDALEFLLQTL